MSKKRKRHSAEFKAKVALEAVKGVQALQAAGQRLPGPSDPGHDVEETADEPSGWAF